MTIEIYRLQNKEMLLNSHAWSQRIPPNLTFETVEEELRCIRQPFVITLRSWRLWKDSTEIWISPTILEIVAFTWPWKLMRWTHWNFFYHSKNL